MYEFDEQTLRKGINKGLGSQGIWTPELENVMFDEIINEALRIHDVSGELAVDECKCIRFTGGDKWYPNGCKIHPNG